MSHRSQRSHRLFKSHTEFSEQRGQCELVQTLSSRDENRYKQVTESTEILQIIAENAESVGEVGLAGPGGGDIDSGGEVTTGDAALAGEIGTSEPGYLILLEGDIKLTLMLYFIVLVVG